MIIYLVMTVIKYNYMLYTYYLQDLYFEVALYCLPIVFLYPIALKVIIIWDS